MTDHQHQFLWTSIQTTGLRPYDGAILEWAFCLADDSPGGTLEPVELWSSVIAAPADTRLKVDSSVAEMHDANGLWAACAALGSPSLPDCEMFLVELLKSKAARGQFVLAGWAPHFALEWLRVHTPTLAKRFAPSVFDVTTLVKAYSVYSGLAWLDIGAPTHRAEADIFRALAMTHGILSTMGWQGCPPPITVAP